MDYICPAELCGAVDTDRRHGERCEGKVTAAMVSEATCIACNVKRVVKGVTPVARGYELRSLECPQCKDLFRIVVRHRRSHASYRAGAFVDSDDFPDNTKRDGGTGGCTPPAV